MFELLSILLPLDVIANSTQSLVAGSGVIPADQLVSQADTSSSLSAGGITATVAALGGLAYKFITDRKNDLNIVSKGSVTDKLIFNEVIDNLRLFVEYCKLEKKEMDLMLENPSFTALQIQDIIIDKGTKETVGVRKARYFNSIIEQFEHYYGNTLSTEQINNYTNNPKQILNSTLNLVKDRTGL